MHRAAAVVLVGCAVAGCARHIPSSEVHGVLQSNAWMMQPHPERGQSTEQAASDRVACEDQVATEWSTKKNMHWHPAWDITYATIIYKDFDACMRDHGYTMVDTTKAAK